MARAFAPGAAALALVLLLPLLPAQACGVPCGYVYPRLLFDLGERGRSYELGEGQSIDLEGTLTFTWDITAEGLAVHHPGSPIVVTFAYPRKPAWLDVRVEPPQLEIPIAPQFVESNASADGVQLVYRYTAPIQVRASLTGPPQVDPEQPPSLLILAQSSESGLYKPGFGVRDLPLDLPGALALAAAQPPLDALRIGEPVPFEVPPLRLEVEGGALRLDAEGPVELWKPASFVAVAEGPGGAARAVDLAVSVLAEDNTLLYTTGLRHRPDGALPFTLTVPGPGLLRVLVAARPVAAASEALFEPLVATFDVLVPGLEWDALRYPDAYRAEYAEPTADFHANNNDLPRQFEKAYRFPVLAGAQSASVQVQLGSSAGAALGAGSVYVEVLGPKDEQLAYGKLDAVTPTLDARLHGPLPAGDYKVRAYGTGLNPQGLAGTELRAALGVFYEDRPLGLVRARGEPRPLAGGALPLGTGGMELELVLHEDPALWAPLHATLVAKDAQGRVALHPDFIVAVRGPLEPGGEPALLYTTGHRHPHDGLLHWGFAPAAPGLYEVSAFAGPTPEASGAFWQPAILSWPLEVKAPTSGMLQYPALYLAEYEDSTSTVRAAQGYQPFDKRYLVPVKGGADALSASLTLMTMAVAQMVEGAGPAALTLRLLDPSGQVLDEAPVAGTGEGAVEALAPLQPGIYQIHVTGVGYAPLDYSGAMYNLTVAVEYARGPTERLGEAAAPPAAPPPAARPAPGFEAALLALLAPAARALRRKR